jgi:hypothetical protein
MLHYLDACSLKGRAGCNFSAISSTDVNALRWDRMGYAHLSKLATEQPQEAYVHWTPSTELWDEVIPHNKIKHMSEYLRDVRDYVIVFF